MKSILSSILFVAACMLANPANAFTVMTADEVHDICKQTAKSATYVREQEGCVHGLSLQGNLIVVSRHLLGSELKSQFEQMIVEAVQKRASSGLTMIMTPAMALSYCEQSNRLTLGTPGTLYCVLTMIHRGDHVIITADLLTAEFKSRLEAPRTR